MRACRVDALVEIPHDPFPCVSCEQCSDRPLGAGYVKHSFGHFELGRVLDLLFPVMSRARPDRGRFRSRGQGRGRGRGDLPKRQADRQILSDDPIPDFEERFGTLG